MASKKSAPARKKVASCLLYLLLLGCRPPVATTPCPAPPAVTDVDLTGSWELRWDRTFVGGWPAELEGELSLRRVGTQWIGTLRFQQSAGIARVDAVRLTGNHVEAIFRWEGKDAPTLELSAWIRESRLVGEMRTGSMAWTPVGGRRAEVVVLVPAHVDHSLPVREPAAAGIAPDALKALLEHATDQRSSAIVIVKDGAIVTEVYRRGYDGGPLVAMSASKSIASLGVGLAVADGKLALDTTMGSLFPDWKSAGPRSAVTVRQLMTHTSGLDPVRADVAARASIRQHALEAKLVFPPGSRFQYDNDAVDFLSVVFKQASGIGLDEALEARIFRKLDVVGARWLKDSEGTPYAAGELAIRPVDLAKIGQMMLDGGVWRGERIVAKEWIDRSLDAGQPYMESCGLLWWRLGEFAPVLGESVLQAWRDAGIDGASLDGARALLGRRFPNMSEYWAAIRVAVGAATYAKIADAVQHGNHVPASNVVRNGPVFGFSAVGSLGQYLVVIPQAHLVAVRMRAWEPSDATSEPEQGEKNGYPELAADVRRLVE